MDSQKKTITKCWLFTYTNEMGVRNIVLGLSKMQAETKLKLYCQDTWRVFSAAFKIITNTRQLNLFQTPDLPNPDLL